MPEEKKSNSENDKIMGILAYLGILVLVPLFAGGKSKFVRYHSNQGLVNLLFALALYTVSIVLTISLPLVGMLVWVVYLAPTLFAILGIINVVNGEQKPLPVIGGITLIKQLYFYYRLLDNL